MPKPGRFKRRDRFPAPWVPNMLLAALSIFLLTADPALAADTGGWGGLGSDTDTDADTDADTDVSDTDCDRSDTSDTDREDCSDEADTDTTTSSAVVTAGELVGEDGGPACETGPGRAGWAGGVFALSLLISRGRRRS